MHLIIDADPIVYRVGFASEQRNYEVVAEDALGNLHEAYFSPRDNKTSLQLAEKWIAENDLTVVDRTAVVLARPVSHALHSVRIQMESIAAAVNNTSGMTVVLSGPGNFREKIATIRPYKGNRDPDHKPVHYQNIRDYLVERYGARVVHGREADDEVSILARQSPSVVATIDKDLDQVPGQHYDYYKKVNYVISDEEAERFFWLQALAGDGTDNVPGCYRVGAKRAAAILDEVSEDPADRWAAVLHAYEASTAKKDCPYPPKQAHAVALETARLVYMQRVPWELWTPPGSPKEYMKGEVE